ncbi:hypothetical protein X777_14316 [Ooceraea biroi]|uniref:Mos1 transposase HTH domain-containing protein n=1 Tax=Ooceraea biroi TaxID=2015173 RepID=A0A026VW75_OOCBI|nr:hypothetical protein X777_14316 [Ooceraea biroi]
MQHPKQHFRHALLLFFNQKKTAAEGYRIIVETYGDSAPSIKTEEVRKFVDEWINSKEESFYRHLLPERWEKVIENEGKYFD